MKTTPLLALLFLFVNEALSGGPGSPPPGPVTLGYFERRRETILDKSKTPRERASAVVAFDACCGEVEEVRPLMDEMLSGLVEDDKEPLCVRFAAVLRHPRYEAKRPDLVDEVIVSDDDAAQEILPRAWKAFRPASVLRALRHRYPVVRGAGLAALRWKLAEGGNTLSDKSAEVLRPMLGDLPRSGRDAHRYLPALEVISNGTGTFDKELAAIALCDVLPPRHRARALVLLKRPLAGEEPDVVVACFGATRHCRSSQLGLVRKAREAGSRKHLVQMLEVCRNRKLVGHLDEEVKNAIEKALGELDEGPAEGKQ